MEVTTSSRAVCREVYQDSTPPLCGSKRDHLSYLIEPLSELTSAQENAVLKAKNYAMEHSVRLALMKEASMRQQEQAKSLQRHQALALMCRIYVGSINFELKEDIIRQAFTPFGPIKNINMSWDPITQKHNGYAFVEYELPEAAQLAVDQMNGAMLGGRNIKVGRPTNMPQAQTTIDDITIEAGRYNRIYIASIHHELAENDIKSVFEAFGKIRSCKLSANSTGKKHNGYGFIEYDTSEASQEAVASMNLFDLGGLYLRVGKAITPPGSLNGAHHVPNHMPTAAAIAAAAATAKIQAMDAASAIRQTNLIGPPSTVASKSIQQPMTDESDATLGDISLPPVPDTTFSPESANGHMSNGTESEVPLLAVPPIGLVNITPSSSVDTGITTFPVTQSRESVCSSNISDDMMDAQNERLKLEAEDSELLTLRQQEDISIKGQSARHLVMQKLMRNATQSKVVILRNMVGHDDVDEYLEGEISEECSRFGKVSRVIIYLEKQSSSEDAEVIVKIFVEFSTSQEALTAQKSLDSRYFGGRIVKSEIYDHNMFIHNDLSG